MAKIEIKPSSLQVRGSEIPNVSGSAILPIANSIFLGRDVSRAGAEIEKLKQDQRAKEDKNRYYELTDQISKDLDLRLSKFKNQSDLESAIELFDDEVNIKNYKSTLDSENKNVRNLVNQWLYKERGSRRTKLANQVTKNHIEKTLFTDTNTLNSLSIDAASSDPFVRDTALGELELWFKDPVNKNTYGETGLSKKQQDIELQIKKTNIFLELKIILSMLLKTQLR